MYQNKIKAITEKLDISEQKLIEFASMPDIEEQLKDRMEALAAAQVIVLKRSLLTFCSSEEILVELKGNAYLLL